MGKIGGLTLLVLWVGLVALDVQAATSLKAARARGRVPASLVPAREGLHLGGPNLGSHAGKRVFGLQKRAHEPGTLAGGRIRFGYSWQR